MMLGACVSVLSLLSAASLITDKAFCEVLPIPQQSTFFIAFFIAPKRDMNLLPYLKAELLVYAIYPSLQLYLFKEFEDNTTDRESLL